MKNTMITGLGSLAAMLLISGCGTTSDSAYRVRPTNTNPYNELALRKGPVPTSHTEVNTRTRSVQVAKPAPVAVRVSPAVKSSSTSGGGLTLPPNAKAGECYARVLVPPSYRTVTEEVVIQEASKTTEIIPAKFEWVESEVLVKEASVELKVIPAEFKTAEERVLVKPETERIEEVPATYNWVEEKVLVKPATTQWKKGRGPVQQVDNSTGEIMCLVEVPAEYKKVRKKVLVKPASTRSIKIPAEYESVSKSVMSKPATTREIKIPAEFKTVRVRKMVKPEQRIVSPIPAQYETVTREVMEKEGRTEWRQILCETNMSRDMVGMIQNKLKEAGYDPGVIDGFIGPQTQMAIRSYQAKNDLAIGAITYETLQKMDISVE